MGNFLRQWLGADYRAIGASFAGGVHCVAANRLYERADRHVQELLFREVYHGTSRDHYPKDLVDCRDNDV